MVTADLVSVESSRFESWFYDQKAFELYVKYPPSKKHPKGPIVAYANVPPEVFEEGAESHSKGQWLGDEIIGHPERYPFRYLAAPDDSAPAAPQPPRAESPLVPEAIRTVAALPEMPLATIPEILPPEVQEGTKPFNQIVRERAAAIAAAVPGSFTVASADAYRALGTALVVIQTERRAVEKALEAIARPMVEAKRNYDLWRNEVMAKYSDAERRLDTALNSFRRAEDLRHQQEVERVRKENADRARKANEEAAAARRAETARQFAAVTEHAQNRIQEAGKTIASTSDSEAVTTAQAEIAKAQSDLEQARRKAAEPVELAALIPAPPVFAKTDLKVHGLRAKPSLWRWRIPGQFFRNTDLSKVVPIRRNSLVKPSEIPDEYWILDEKAVAAHVKSMDGVSSIPQVETFDLNA